MIRSNDKLGELLSPVYFEIEKGSLFGKSLQIDMYSYAQPGNELYYDKIYLWYYWISPSGEVLFSSSVKMEEVGSFPKLGGSMWWYSGDLPAGTNAYLRVAARIVLYHRPDGSTMGQYYESYVTQNVPSVKFGNPPGQLVANPPDYTPTKGTSFSVWSSIDLNGSGTQYQSEHRSGDGVHGVTSSWQDSNHFILEALYAPTAKWRARAKNDFGEGEWSDWCIFNVNNPIDGYINGWIDVMPTKPIHKLIASFNCTSGHSITSYKWDVYKKVGGVWTLQYSSTASSIAVTFDDVMFAEYRVNVEVGDGTVGNIFTAYYDYSMDEDLPSSGGDEIV